MLYLINQQLICGVNEKLKYEQEEEMLFFLITIKFLQHQFRGVHVVAVTQVPGVFIGVYGQSLNDVKTGNR